MVFFKHEICRKNHLKAAVYLVCFIVVIAATRFWYMEEQGNFHPITPNEAYRSAQMDQDELEYYINKFGIKSIINLRGKSDGEDWYKEEAAICRNFTISHYDLALSADKAPTSREIEELIGLFRSVPRPVLIHCQAGADRSGLAAAIWKMAIDRSSKSVAMEQLSIRFGHMPFGPTQVLDSFIKNWEIGDGPQKSTM
jgi:protein tyrosine/serine phosphatase